MPKNKSPPPFEAIITKLVIVFKKPITLTYILERITKMPILDSDLNDAGVFQLIPRAVYNAHVIKVELKGSRDTNAPMAVLDWVIDEGEFAGREVRYNNVMLGGKTKEGKPQPLGNLCSLIHHANLAWSCKRCNASFHGDFLIADKHDRESGLKPGNYYCSACKNPEPGIIWDTDVLATARCGIDVGSKKQEGTGKEFNEVKGYAFLKE